MIKTSKRQKTLFSLFCVMFIAISVTPIVASAIDSSTVTIDIADYIDVRTGLSNIARTLGFGVLKFLADFIDVIYESVDTIVDINLYTIVSNQFNFSGYAFPLAWAILSVTLVVIVLRIFAKSDDGQMHEDIQKYLLCALIIIIFPAFISACGDMKSALKSDVDEISVGGNSDLSLGNQILGSVIIDVFQTAETGVVTPYVDVDDNTIIPEYLSINAVLDEDDFAFKISEEPATYIEFLSLHSMDFDTLISRFGLQDLYNEYTVAKASRTTISRGKYETVVNDEGEGKLTYTITEYTADEFANHYMLPTAKASSYATKTNEVLGVNASNYTTWIDFENALNEGLEIYAMRLLSSTDEDSEAVTITDKDGNKTDKYINALFDKDDYDALVDSVEDDLLAIGEIISRNITTLGKPYENIYKYDINFLYGLVVMLATLLALIFACFRLAKLLYEVVFIEIVAPIFIAIDSASSQGQKAKQVLTNLVSSYALFIVVILVLKIYLIVVLELFTMTQYNLVVKLIVIIGGASFVIDGPDIIVKLLGIDAGVKSGYGAMRGAMAVGQGAISLGKTAGKLGSKVSPTNVASKMGEHKAKKQAKSDAKEQAKAEGKGKVGQFVAGQMAGMGQGKVGSAFKKSAVDKARLNNDYAQVKGGSPSSSQSTSTSSSGSSSSSDSSSDSSSSGSSSQPITVKGDKGDTGERGGRGEQGRIGNTGERGERGKRGERGANGTSADSKPSFSQKVKSTVGKTFDSTIFKPPSHSDSETSDKGGN